MLSDKPKPSSKCVNPETGFVNYAPRGREERRVLADKQQYEKNMLANRKENFQRNDPNPNPLYVPQDALGFLPNDQLYHGDVVGEEKAEREYITQRKKDIFQRAREERAQKEDMRWNKIEQQYQKEDRIQKFKQDSSKANFSSVQYNLITLSDGNSEMAAYQDNLAHYKGAVRANILQKNNNKEGFNPITGESYRPVVPIPPKPVLPTVKK